MRFRVRRSRFRPFDRADYPGRFVQPRWPVAYGYAANQRARQRARARLFWFCFLLFDIALFVWVVVW